MNYRYGDQLMYMWNDTLQFVYLDEMYLMTHPMCKMTQASWYSDAAGELADEFIDWITDPAYNHIGELATIGVRPIARAEPTNTSDPTGAPTMEPTTHHPTHDYTTQTPTMEPTVNPTKGPTIEPTAPTMEPTDQPTADPTSEPTADPTEDPTFGFMTTELIGFGTTEMEETTSSPPATPAPTTNGTLTP